jgi:YHS domain-containing protein
MKDPVCGMQVDEKKNPPRTTYQGTQYAFCSQPCKEKFDRSPQQYIGQSQQSQQAGRQTGGGGAGAGGF